MGHLGFPDERLDGDRGLHSRDHGRVVVGDLPGVADLGPEVREPRGHLLPRARVPEVKGVEAGVEVGGGARGHDRLVGDGAEGLLLEEVGEVVHGALGRLDVARRDGGEEGHGGGVHGRHHDVVAGLQGAVPRLKVLVGRGVQFVLGHEVRSGKRRRMVVDDFPLAIDFLPHVRKAGFYGGPSVGIPYHKGIHSGVKI